MTPDPKETIVVRDDPEHSRFVTEVDGHVAFLAYRRDGKSLVLVHTEVPREIGGRGIAEQLVRTAFATARAEHLRVLPYCPYVRAFLKRHPEFEDLTSDAPR